MSKILFTGATGVLGRAGVPLLVEAGHDVIGVARSPVDAGWLEEVGARPANVDLFSERELEDALAGIDTVIHYATSIPPQSEMTKRRSWDDNDRLRDIATSRIVDAALATGVERMIQQSVTFAYADGGDDWLDEESTIDPMWDVLDSALAAEDHVSRFRAKGGTGVVLRLSRLYGPGPVSADYIAAVTARKIPIVGRGDNYVSSIHVEDAATALMAAMDVADGTYNVSDDEPVTSTDYVGSLARELGAAKPRHIPEWMARLGLGKAVGLFTTSQRVSNRRFVEATDWSPTFSSVEAGWRHIVGTKW